jgi:hypothetical protein
MVAACTLSPQVSSHHHGIIMIHEVLLPSAQEKMRKERKAADR